MIVHNVQQNTPEWLLLRAGKVTASALSRILKQDGKLRDSEGVQTYINELVAETLLGQPLVQDSNAWMARGHDQEDEAANWYAFDREVVVSTCGFFTTDDGRIGASCDRLVGEDGILEIKVPGPAEHVGNMRSMTSKYFAQCQGQLFVADSRDWVDLLSYHCDLSPAVSRIARNDKFQANMHEALACFLNQFDEALAACLAYGEPIRHCAIMTAAGRKCGSTDGVTESDGVFACAKCNAELSEIFG